MTNSARSRQICIWTNGNHFYGRQTSTSKTNEPDLSRKKEEIKAHSGLCKDNSTVSIVQKIWVPAKTFPYSHEFLQELCASTWFSPADSSHLDLGFERFIKSRIAFSVLLLHHFIRTLMKAKHCHVSIIIFQYSRMQKSLKSLRFAHFWANEEVTKLPAPSINPNDLVSSVYFFSLSFLVFPCSYLPLWPFLLTISFHEYLLVVQTKLFYHSTVYYRAVVCFSF